MDRAEGALIVAEKALFEAKRAISLWSDLTVSERVDELSSSVASAKKDVEDRVNIVKQEIINRISELENRLNDFNKSLLLLNQIVETINTEQITLDLTAHIKSALSVERDVMQEYLEKLIPPSTKGDPGEPGSSVTLDDVIPFIREQIDRTVSDTFSSIPKPKDGDSVTVEDVTPVIVEQVALVSQDLDRVINDKVNHAVDSLVLPSPKEVDLEIINNIVADAVKNIPKPVDGYTPTDDDIIPLIDDIVDRKVQSLPKPKDGISVVESIIDQSGCLIQTMSDGTVKNVGVVVAPVTQTPEIDIEGIRSSCMLGIDNRFESVYNEMRRECDEIQRQIQSIDTPGTVSISDQEWEKIRSLVEDRVKTTHAELVDIPYADYVKEIVGQEIAKIVSAVDTNTASVIDPIEEIPTDVATKVARAIAIVAESPIMRVESKEAQPIVVNITQPSPPAPRSGNRRIVTSRDKDGNMVAEVVDKEDP